MNALTASERIAAAAIVGVNEQYLYQCLTGRRAAPPERCPAIERATGGKITVLDLRPDVRWHRIPDADWPHPDGRPCIDVAAPAVPAQEEVRDAAR